MYVYKVNGEEREAKKKNKKKYINKIGEKEEKQRRKEGKKCFI